MHIKFHKEGSIFLLIFLFSMLFMMQYVITFNNLDYIWNYGFSAKIALGLMPYRDFDVLQTPLAFYITAFFLKFFGNYIIVYIVSGAFIITLMYYLFFITLLKITNDKKFAVTILLISAIYTMANFTIYNYNILAIIIILLIINAELGERTRISNNLKVGFLLALLFLTKQNVSAIAITMMSVNILFSQLTLAKKIKLLLIRAGIFLLIILSYLFYLYLNDSVYNFIDHTILGILDFSGENKYIDSPIIFVFLIIPIFLVAKAVRVLIKSKNYRLDNKLLIILCYSLVGFSMIYPIFDGLHLSIGVLLSFLLIVFIYPPAKLNNNRLLIMCFAILTISFANVAASFFYSDNKYFSEVDSYYRYMLIDKDVNEHLDKVKHYIDQRRLQDYDIVILDTSAMIYLFNSGDYSNRFDMLVQGNLGYKGESKVMRRIGQLSDNTLFLLSDIERQQEIKSLKSYVKCHYDYVEKIEDFLVYRKPSKIQASTDCNM